MELDDCVPVTSDRLLEQVASCKPMGYRFVTISCVDVGGAFDLIYHFDKDYSLRNMRLRIEEGQSVPSISSIYFAAALVENEIKDLFGLSFTGLALDYEGRFILSEGAPTAPMRKSPAPGVTTTPPERKEIVWPKKQ
jgi:NADH:ubiquinone oxidoreductase subunit C